MKTKEKITWIICVAFILALLIVFAWYVYATHSPAIGIVRMEADNNTLEIAKIMSAKTL